MILDMIKDGEGFELFQTAIKHYRESRSGYLRDHIAVCDFLEARDQELEGVKTESGRFRLYPYLKEMKEKEPDRFDEFYEGVFIRFYEIVDRRLAGL